VSPDGKNLYVGSGLSQAVARINRFTDRSIRQPGGVTGCINSDGSEDCADGAGFGDPFTSVSTAVAPDGRNVYVASGVKGSVMRLNRVS
jgi:hypothetical protein